MWLEGKNLRTYHPTSKLAPRRYGPFNILDKVGTVVYRLDLPKHWEIHNVFHVDLLTPYIETDEHGANFPRPALELIEGQEEWEVEAILGKRWKKGWGKNKAQFLVKWMGFPNSENMWLDEDDITAPDLVQAFHTRHLQLAQADK